ncbi:solute carrier family 25 member 44-like [Branchiostoma floridae x Branchiostoma belcheri]
METMSADPTNQIRIIEWNDMDKRKFYSFGLFLSMTIRVTVYPTTLIKTRLQIQRGTSLYNGTFDAFMKITRQEGARGLYKGFLVNSLYLISGQMYITTYEVSRQQLSGYSNWIKSLVGGGMASLVGMSISVPIDVVSQHLMLQGQGKDRRKKLPKERVTFGKARAVVIELFRRDGMAGFYRGFFASMLTTIPNSALWWPFYHFYAEQLASVAPSYLPHLMLQAVAGPLAAATANTLTNPMDIVRARLQVEGGKSIVKKFKQLYVEEGLWGFSKGLSARIIGSLPTTFVIVVGYETLKKLSLRSDLVHTRQW